MGRQATIKTPLGEDELLFVSLQGGEELSKLFSYNLELFSQNESIDTSKILGESVTIKLENGDEDPRYFNGIVSDFTQVGRAHSTYAVYHASVKPWLWFLSRSADCRMFQEKTVPEIVKEVFSDNGFSDFELKLNENYLPWEYCVQYRETDLHFISRLLEQEGIYYYFKHEDGKHTLILADSISSHEKLCKSALPYNDNDDIYEDHLSNWVIHNTIQSGSVTLNDYDFKAPQKQLLSSAKVQRQHAEAGRDFFDYPGEYVQKGDRSRGDAESRNRIDAFHVNYEQLEGQTNCRAFCVGGTFSMSDHPRKDQNREYLLRTANFIIGSEQFTSGQGGIGEAYSCTLTAIPTTTPFRPAPDTAKPTVQGPQAAFVVDDQPDEYGRVKVQFYWDREEQASCWVRVSQNSAGTGWGSMFVPHVGHEVLVSFYEGDPDRPIITGKVYNADNMPPGEWSGDINNSVITDHGGNHFVMTGESGAEKIELRDTYGNELVMDAVEGTIRIYSPSHKSEMVLGRSVKIESLSDYSLSFGGDKFQEIMGKTKVEYGADVANFFAGAKSSVFVGINNSSQLAATFSEFIGIKTSVSKALDISKNFDKKVFVDKKVSRTAETSVTEKSPKIVYQAEKSLVSLNAKKAFIGSGASRVDILKDAQIKIMAKTKVNMSGPDQVSISAKSGGIKAKAGSKGIKLNSSGAVTVNGSKIKLG